MSKIVTLIEPNLCKEKEQLVADVPAPPFSGAESFQSGEQCKIDLPPFIFVAAGILLVDCHSRIHRIEEDGC